MTRLLSAHTVIIDDNGSPTAVTDHTLVIDGAIITNILPTDEALSVYPSAEHTQLNDHILAPGLVNAHGHAAMALFRGYSDDLPLKNWLEEAIWPAEQRWVNEDFVRDGTELAIAEMLLSGTTCFADMYFFAETTASVARATGIRAQIAPPIMEHPSACGSGADDYISQTVKLHDRFKNNDLIHVAFGPHAPYTVNDDSLQRIAALSNEIEAPVQIHLHETRAEIEESIQKYGMRPIERIHQLGLLSARTQCVHMTQINETDIALLRQTQAHVIHCPQSNQKLASGISPITQLLQAGVNVAIGTDSAASNNSLNLFSELKSAALQAKISNQNAACMPAHTALTVATLNGAKALGLDEVCGSLKIGKQADIIAINTATPNMQPLHHAISQLVYAEPTVNHVWVAGKQLVKDQELTSLSLNNILQKANTWKHKIND